ncbi:MAG: gamma-glutamyltransferase [Candidatus Dormibacteria bacterium]
MFERFGTQSWQRLVAPAVEWATEGHVVDSFEHLVMAHTVDFYLYTPSGREHFTPGGHLPQVGDRWPKPVLAATMKRLSEEGPDHFITGEWAEHFVARGNELGWPVTLEQMTLTPPRWASGTRYRHGEYEIVQLSPPERLGHRPRVTETEPQMMAAANPVGFNEIVRVCHEWSSNDGASVGAGCSSSRLAVTASTALRLMGRGW